MKLLKKIASLAVATVIVVQGAGLGSLSVLADGEETLQATQKVDYVNEFQYNKSSNTAKSKTFTYTDWYGAYDLTSDDLVDATVIEKFEKRDIIAERVNPGEAEEYVFLSDCLFTFEETGTADGVYRIINADKDASLVIADYTQGGGLSLIGHLNQAMDITVNSNGDGTFTFVNNGFTKPNALGFLPSVNAANHSFAYSRSDVNSTAITSGLIYAYSVDANGDPVYTKVDSLDKIVSGNQYLIAFEYEGEKYAVRPKLAASPVRITDVFTTGYTKVELTVKDNPTTEILQDGDSFYFPVGQPFKYGFKVVESVKTPTTNAQASYSVAALELLAGEEKEIKVVGTTVDSVDYKDEYIDVNVDNDSRYDTCILSYDNNGLQKSGLASQALFEFEEAASGGYVIESVEFPGIYLNIQDISYNGYMFAETAQTFTISHNDGSKLFRLTQNSTNETLFYTSSSNFNYNSGYNDYVYDFMLYKRVDGAGSSEIPGYMPVTTVTSGEQYLIVAATEFDGNVKRDVASLYLLYPTTANNRHLCVASITDSYVTGSSVVTVTAKKTGNSTLTLNGDKEIGVSVQSFGESFTSEDTVLNRSIKINGSNHNTKVTSLVVNSSYNDIIYLSLDSNATLIDYFSSDSSLVSVKVASSKTSLSLRVNSSAYSNDNSVRTVYIGVKYSIDNVEYVKNIPVYVCMHSGTLKVTSYIKDMNNVTAYYNVSGEKINSSNYLQEVNPDSFFYLKDNLFVFIKPEDGYEFISSFTADNVKFHYFDEYSYWNLFNSSIINEAKALGCVGGFVLYDYSYNYNAIIDGQAVCLPTVTAEEWAILRGGNEDDSVPYTSDEVIFAGDKLVWKITVDVPEDMTAVFGETKLSSTLAGSDFNGNGNSKEISKDLKVGEVVEYRLVFDVPEDMTSAEFEIAIDGTYTLGTSDAKNYSVTKSFSFDVTKKPASSDKVNIYTEDLTVSPETTIQTIYPSYPLSTSDKINVSKIYYVVAGQEATLKDFADGNNLDCIFNIYELDSTDVTSSFKVADDGTSMLFTATASGEQNFIITYSSGVYAIRIVALKPSFTGMVVGMSTTLNMNYIISFADLTSAEENANKKGYSSYADKKAVDYSNMPAVISNTEKASYTVKMYRSGEEPVSSAGNYSRYRYDNILPYQLGDKIIGDLYDSNGNLIDTVSYSVEDYLKMAMSKNEALYTSVLVYCAFAEKYAAENGWIDASSATLNSYTSSVPTATITSSTYSNIKTDNCEFNNAYLTLEEGMAVSITVEFKLGADVDLSSCNMIIYSDVNDGLYYMGSGAKVDGKYIQIPGTEFVAVEGQENTYKFTITGIPPVYWDYGYKMYLDVDGNTTGLTFSVYDYLQKLEAKTEDGTTLDSLLKAMYTYGEEVTARFNMLNH